MNFLMISKCGEGAQLLYKIAEEGNSVRLYIEQEEDRSCWSGILPQITSPVPNHDEVVIFDQSGMGRLASNIAKTNPVFGGSIWADHLEDDRMFGIEMMKKAGIQVPDTHNFKDHQWEDAHELIFQSDTKWVFKPSGHGLPSRLSYVPSDSDDLHKYLTYVREAYGEKISSFILQEFVEGALISTEFWCDGTRFVGPANHTVEAKKLMNDDLGPSTGCSGNLIWVADDDLAVMALRGFESECVKQAYKGCIDLNAIVNDKGVFGLEWTPRFGYDAMPTILQLMQQDIGEVISNFARGQASYFPMLLDGFAGGVRLSIPPYPLEPPKTKDIDRVGPNVGIPIRGFHEGSENHIYFLEIMKNGDDILHSAGSGAIAVVSDVADDDPAECFTLPYSILDDVKIPDKMYRTDLATVLPKMYEKFQEVKEESHAISEI
jgi:phosphoribosylamine--glycine ligase